MRLLLITCAVFLSMRAAAADFRAFAGTWRFSEEATVALWRAEAKTEEEKKEVERTIAIKREIREQLNIPFHSDLIVSRKVLVGIRTMLAPRYDLISAEEKSGVIVAQVLWHEDQNDPGDASKESVELSLRGKQLRLDTEPGIRVGYLFDKE